jgi:hypothetical protein
LEANRSFTGNNEKPADDNPAARAASLACG